jgi:hypothetical protein
MNKNKPYSLFINKNLNFYELTSLILAVKYFINIQLIETTKVEYDIAW